MTENSCFRAKKGCVGRVNFNLYHYAGNNPVKYTDPDGNEIVLYAENGDYSKILDDINSLSYKQYTVRIGSDGQVFLTEAFNLNSSGSLAYSEAIDKGVSDKTTKIVIGLCESGAAILPGKIAVDFRNRGGGATYRNSDRTLIFALYTGKTGYADGLGYVESCEVLMHEIGCHAIPQINPSRDAENAIEIDNVMRNQCGLCPRPSDASHLVGVPQ